MPAEVNGILAALKEGGAIPARVAIIAAHPDDETIGLGGQLHRFEDGLLVHVTDGAPRNGRDAAERGFASANAYAAAREGELAAALAAGGAGSLRRMSLGLADQEAWLDPTGLTEAIAALLRRESPAAVLTHPYEGGHPDHDAVAFAVQTARSLLGIDGEPVPPCIEWASYHAVDGHQVTGSFLPAATAEITIVLGDETRRRKRRMFDCFVSQQNVLAGFEIACERFRQGPVYDFRGPPHSGKLCYEGFGWEMTGADWRRRAGEALDRLRLAGTA